MRKFLISAAVTASALAAAAPAAAQVYPAPRYNQGAGYQNHWLFDFRNQRYARMMQDRVTRIRHDIRQMAAQRILSRGEFRSLDGEARLLQDRIFRSSRNGVNRNEARRIDRSVRRLEERVVREARDWNRRTGVRRYNPWNYNQYWNQYDRDRDGRNDRYEDDHGRDRD